MKESEKMMLQPATAAINVEAHNFVVASAAASAAYDCCGSYVFESFNHERLTSTWNSRTTKQIDAKTAFPFHTLIVAQCVLQTLHACWRDTSP